ncbi:hypothetical protein GCM10022631_35800 [Deinococcus rubellus]
MLLTLKFELTLFQGRRGAEQWRRLKLILGLLAQRLGRAIGGGCFRLVRHFAAPRVGDSQIQKGGGQ